MALASGRAISTFIRPRRWLSFRSSGRTNFMSTSSMPKPGSPANRCSSRRHCRILRTAAVQGAGAIHVHPNGRFVYLTNRTFPVTDSGAREFGGRRKQRCGLCRRSEDRGARSHPEYRRLRRSTPHLQHRPERPAVGRGEHHRCRRRRRSNTALPAGLTVFRIGADGKLALARKYDVDVGEPSSSGAAWSHCPDLHAAKSPVGRAKPGVRHARIQLVRPAA